MNVYVITLIAFFCIVNATYFKLEEGQQRCFLEEIPKDTLIVGTYKAEEALGNADARYQQFYQPTTKGIKVTVNDPENNVLMNRDFGAEGRFAFTSQMGGEHKICLQTNSSKWFGAKSVLRLHINIDVGSTAVDYEGIAKTEHLSAIEVQVRRLNDRIRDIRAEQNYQRNREAAFRNTSESTNARVMWWSIIQTAILVATGLWQITHLKNFFKTKKLV